MAEAKDTKAAAKATKEASKAAAMTATDDNPTLDGAVESGRSVEKSVGSNGPAFAFGPPFQSCTTGRA